MAPIKSLKYSDFYALLQNFNNTRSRTGVPVKKVKISPGTCKAEKFCVLCRS